MKVLPVAPRPPARPSPGAHLACGREFDGRLPTGWLLLREFGVLEAVPGPADRMYEVEALQVYLQSPALQGLVHDADPMAEKLTPAEVRRLAEAMSRSRLISDALRGRLTELTRSASVQRRV
jgi:hypothetical protein